MELLSWLAGIPLCLMLSLVGIGKSLGWKVSLETRYRLGVSAGLWKSIGATETAAMGIIVAAIVNGWKTAGVAAATGVLALMVGAIIYHGKAKDLRRHTSGRSSSSCSPLSTSSA